MQKMLSFLLLGALLLVHPSLGAPNLCDELCRNNKQNLQSSYTGSMNNMQNLQSSYSGSYKSSFNAAQQYSGSLGGSNSEQYYKGSNLGSRSGSDSGLGSQGGRLETFEDNAVGNNNNNVQHTNVQNSNNNVQNTNVQNSNFPFDSQDRPGSWQDEKHYKTNDGKGEVNYRAGQTSSDNGFTKFVEHSYHFSSQGNVAGHPNSQVVSNEDFNRELQNIRSSIRSSMSQFDAANTFDKFNELYTNDLAPLKFQLENICNHTSFSSFVHQQAARMMQQFDELVDQHFRQFQGANFPADNQQPANLPYSSRQRRDYPNLDKIIGEQIDKVEKAFSKFKNPNCEEIKALKQREGAENFNKTLKEKVDLLTSKFQSFNQQNLSANTRQRMKQVKEDFDASIVKVRKCVE